MESFSVVEKDTGQVVACVWEEDGKVQGICQDNVVVRVDEEMLSKDETNFINDVLDEIIERLERIVV